VFEKSAVGFLVRDPPHLRLDEPDDDDARE